VRRSTAAALVLMMLGAGTLIGEASAPAELPPQPGTILAVLPAPTAAPTPSPTVTPEPTPEEVATAEPEAEDTATPEPEATEAATAEPEATETATPEATETPEPPKHVIVVALSGPALEVPGDLTTLDTFDGSDLAPFGALAQLAPPAKAYVQSLTTPCADDPAPLYDRSRNPLPGCVEAKLDDLPGDFSDPLTAPAFAYVLPDACHDGRDGDWCGGGKTAAQRAEAWLKEWIPQITESPAFADGGALAVVFGEGAAVTPSLQAEDSRGLVLALLR
jgi:hypothetical protein